ncbi:hypothetical protein AAG906_014681 [Vitis piasezkii]
MTIDYLNNRMENLSILRDRLISMEEMGDFKKLFIFFSCVTLLAPTSKLDGSHELWCTLLAKDFDINVNWGQFVLDSLVAGIRHFNDLMKKMVHAELQDYGDFGLVYEYERGENTHEDPTNLVDEVEEETSDIYSLIVSNNERNN